jgi:D-beta-D-heptose 7-phosphate kinase/D-beta-D-heptose 1-phosphate adenosyltransferase
MTMLAHLIERFSGRRIGVIGDVMLDHFVIGTVDRISPEAPVPVVKFAREEYRLGGAANVAHNLSTLGAEVRLVGLVGQDDAAATLARELAAHRLSAADLVADPDRPTTQKTRIVTSRNQQVARIDREEDGESTAGARAALAAAASSVASAVDAVVLSDYRKGVVTPDIIASAIAAADGRRVPVLVDPKVPEAARYRGATLLTPNHHEAELMTGITIRTDEDAARAARRLHELTGASVVITRGEHGMWVLDTSGRVPEETGLPAVAREVADVTGAGDTVIAVFAMALSARLALVDAARLANAAAGLVVARFGPATIRPDELRQAVAALSV